MWSNLNDWLKYNWRIAAPSRGQELLVVRLEIFRERPFKSRRCDEFHEDSTCFLRPAAKFVFSFLKHVGRSSLGHELVCTNEGEDVFKNSLCINNIFYSKFRTDRAFFQFDSFPWNFRTNEKTHHSTSFSVEKNLLCIPLENSLKLWRKWIFEVRQQTERRRQWTCWIIFLENLWEKIYQETRQKWKKKNNEQNLFDLKFVQVDFLIFLYLEENETLLDVRVKPKKIKVKQESWIKKKRLFMLNFFNTKYSRCRVSRPNDAQKLKFSEKCLSLFFFCDIDRIYFEKIREKMCFSDDEIDQIDE